MKNKLINLYKKCMQIFYGEKVIKNYYLNPIWQERVKEVLAAPENDKIKRVKDAGKIRRNQQIMHNGIKIKLGSYYGYEIAKLLLENKGVHEPQEEYVFELVLEGLNSNATMIELGAYWGFYSIWFNKKVLDAKNYLIEPNINNIRCGMENCRINKVKAHFTNAYVSDQVNMQKNCITMDDFVNQNNINFIDILHSDIQGYELKMLKGCKKIILEKKIKYLFISTHGQIIHNQCVDFLVQNNFFIICEINENESFSYDGLIVARSLHYKGIGEITVSKNTKVTYEKKFDIIHE